MADDNDTRAGLRQALDIGPVLAFVAGYIWLRDETVTVGGHDYEGFVIVTALFIPILMASSYALYRLTGKVSRMQIVTLVMVLVFGGLTVWLNDERFFKMKSTIAFGIFAGLLGIGLLRGQSWLKFVLDGALPLTDAGWMLLTRRLALFFVVMAAANELIWRNFSTDIFVAWDTFGQMGAMMAFFLAQVGLLKKYADD
jgi:intracellular septation protein